MSQLLQPYELPILSSDVQFGEVMLDVIYALERLTATVDDVFGKIEKRLGDEKQRMASINLRVSTCQTKVQSVKGSNKATTVFSTAKYPAPKTLPLYPTLFSQVAVMPSPHREATDDTNYVLNTTNRVVIGNGEIANEVLTILGRLNSHGSDMERVEFIIEDEGLGALPGHVPSVGSLLLFNSDMNPYKEYQTLDNLSSTGRVKTGENEEAKGLASAPSTMLSGDALPDITALDLTFRPEMGEMCSLALPTNLPLDFLADIQYTGMALPSIAPSSHRANLSLPQITDGGYSSAPSLREGKGAPPPPPSFTSSSASAPPPPPPPPSGPAPPVAMSTASSSAPPPPPPPGPTVTATAPVAPTATAGPPPPPLASSAADDTAAAAGPPPAANGRASLLDAIKGMGVTKLRSKEESSMAAAKVQKKEEAKKPLSMAEDLKARLMRRNNAISGKSDKDQQRKDSMVVQAAREQQSQSQAAVKPVPLTAAGKKSVAASVFPSAAADSDDDDDKRAVPARKPARKDDDDDSSVSSGSDMSDMGTAGPAKTKSSATPIPPPLANNNTSTKAKPPAAVVTSPVTAAPPQDARRGSLLDAESVGNMLSMAKNNNNKKTNQSDSDDSSDEAEDWD